MLLVVLVIAAGLIAFGGTMDQQVTKTGQTIDSWFEKVRGSTPANNGNSTNQVKSKTAFAVYSADDQSLDFYKRTTVPESGSLFNGKTVTEVYTGFETELYSATGYLESETADTPWWGIHSQVLRVEVVDSGIKPKSLESWFQNFSNCKTFKLRSLDTSQVTSMRRTFNLCKNATEIDIAKWNINKLGTMQEAFNLCSSLESLDLSGWATPSLWSLHSTFNSCYKLKSLKLGSGWDTSNVTASSCTFFCAYALSVDCTEWNVSKVTDHSWFANQAPGVMEPNWLN